MGQLLPEDDKTGPLSWSPNLDLPFLPVGSNQAVAIINALVRILDTSVVARENGVANKLTIQNLTAVSAVLTALTASNAELSAASINSLVSDSLSSGSADITTLTAANSTLSNTAIGTAAINTLTVANKIIQLSIGALTADTASIAELTASTKVVTALLQATSATLTSITAVNGTITNLSATNLVAQRITADEIISLANQHTSLLKGTHTITPNSITTKSIALPYIPGFIKGKVLCTIAMKDSGGDPHDAYLFYDIFNSYIVSNSGVVTCDMSMSTPTYFAEPSYANLLPGTSVGRTIEWPLTLKWPLDVSIPASLSNYHGLDLFASSSNNGFTIEVQVGSAPNTSFSVANTGSGVLVTLATDDDGVAIGISLGDLATAITNSGRIQATVHAGVSAGTIVSTAFSAGTLSGGSSTTITNLSPAVFTINTSGTALTLATELTDQNKIRILPNDTVTIEQITIGYVLEVSK